MNWARDDPRPDAKKRKRTEHAEQVEAALKNRAAALGWTKPEIDAISTRGKPDFIGPVGPYPDTSPQFQSGHGQAVMDEPAGGPDGPADGPGAALSQTDLAQQEAESNMRRLESALLRLHPIP